MPEGSTRNFLTQTKTTKNRQPFFGAKFEPMFSRIRNADNLLSFTAAFTMLFNPLALELDIYSLAHHLRKMLIFYEPRRVTLGNTRHFVEE